MPDFDFKDRVVVITGSTRGLGHEMAQGFAARGATVVVSSRKADACEAVAKDITATTGSEAVGIPTHVGHWDELDSLTDQVYGRFGRVDVLVNNAGISPTYERLVDVSEDLWDRTFAVNLKGAFRLTALVGGRMAAAGSGSVINISSVASIRPSPDWLPYSAAKAGLNAITEGFAQALGPQVRVNGIICGAFSTDISSDWDATSTDERLQSTTAIKRLGHPAELVGAVLYLASDSASYTTGTLIRVDGGRV